MEEENERGLLIAKNDSYGESLKLLLGDVIAPMPRVLLAILIETAKELIESLVTACVAIVATTIIIPVAGLFGNLVEVEVEVLEEEDWED